MRSTLAFPTSSAAARIAASAASGPWRRPSFASTPGSKDWTPTETRFTPAARSLRSRSRSQDSGFASIVTSASLGNRSRSRIAAITSATSSGSQSEGVPPPRYRLTGARPSNAGARSASSARTARAYRRSPGTASVVTAKSQYGQRWVQYGKWTYTPSGRGMAVVLPRRRPARRLRLAGPRRPLEPGVEEVPREQREGDEGEQVGARPLEERVVRARPAGEDPVDGLEHPGHERDHDPRDGAAGDVSRGEQDARALVGLGEDLLLVEPAGDVARAAAVVDEPADEAAGQDRRRGGEGEVDTDRERERGDAGHLEHERDHDAEEHEPPRQPAVEDALDDVRHERRLRRVELADLGAVGAARSRAPGKVAGSTRSPAGATSAAGTYVVAASFKRSRIGPRTSADTSAPKRIAVCWSRGVAP